MASHLWNRTEWGRAALARFFYLSMALDVGVMSEITQLLRDSPTVGADSESSTRALYRDPRDRDYTVEIPRVMTHVHQITSYLVTVV